MKRMKEKRGITLIALVVTIIILLILAGIALSITFGEGGLIQRSINATAKTDIASTREQIELELVGRYDDNGNYTNDDVIEAVKIATGQKIEEGTESITTVKGNEVDISDLWKTETNYIITFDSNGGEGTMESQEVAKGRNTTLPVNTFTRENYIFTEWNTTANGTGTSYEDGGTININEDITLYAVWIKEGTLDIKYPGITWETLGKIADEISNDTSVTNTSEEATVTVDGTSYTVGVGDTKSIVYNSTTYITRILGFNHDDLTTSSKTSTGKAGISFEFVECIKLATMHDHIDVDLGVAGWGESDMLTTLGSYGSGGCYSNLISSNSGLSIKQVVKQYIATYDSASSVRTTNNYIWLLACSEIWDNAGASGAKYGYAIGSEGAQYEYYAKINATASSSNTSLVKKYGSYNEDWWLRSPCSYSKSEFCCVNSTGASSYSLDDNWLGVFPCFSI